jgi:hypothetical protein
MQIDYVDIYMDKEIFGTIEDMDRIKKEEYDDVSQIFNRALDLIGELKNRWSIDHIGLETEYAKARDVWLETLVSWEKAFWGEDLDNDFNHFLVTANQLDTYVGRLEDILKDWEKIETMFLQSETAISDVVRQQGFDKYVVSFLEELNARAKSRWANLDACGTRMFLEAILDPSVWREKAPDFEAAYTAIAKADEMGTLPNIVNGMKHNYKFAFSYVVDDYQRAQVYLNSILYTAKKYFGIRSPEKESRVSV